MLSHHEIYPSVDLLSSRSFIRSWTCPTLPSTGCQVSSAPTPIPPLPTRLSFEASKIHSTSLFSTPCRGGPSRHLSKSPSQDTKPWHFPPSLVPSRIPVLPTDVDTLLPVLYASFFLFFQDLLTVPTTTLPDTESAVCIPPFRKGRIVML